MSTERKTRKNNFVSELIRAKVQRINWIKKLNECNFGEPLSEIEGKEIFSRIRDNKMPILCFQADRISGKDAVRILCNEIQALEVDEVFIAWGNYLEPVVLKQSATHVHALLDMLYRSCEVVSIAPKTMDGLVVASFPNPDQDEATFIVKCSGALRNLVVNLKRLIPEGVEFI